MVVDQRLTRREQESSDASAAPLGSTPAMPTPGLAGPVTRRAAGSTYASAARWPSRTAPPPGGRRYPPTVLGAGLIFLAVVVVFALIVAGVGIFLRMWQLRRR